MSAFGFVAPIWFNFLQVAPPRAVGKVQGRPLGGPGRSFLLHPSFHAVMNWHGTNACDELVKGANDDRLRQPYRMPEKLLSRVGYSSATGAHWLIRKQTHPADQARYHHALRVVFVGQWLSGMYCPPAAKWLSHSKVAMSRRTHTHTHL